MVKGKGSKESISYSQQTQRRAEQGAARTPRLDEYINLMQQQ